MLEGVTIKFNKDELVEMHIEKENSKEINFISFGEFCNLILDSRLDKSKDEEAYFETPYLPMFGDGVGVFKYRLTHSGFGYYFMVMRERKVTYNYADMKFEGVHMPQLIFGVKLVNNIISKIGCVVCKDYIISDDSKLYEFPLGNVCSYDGVICFGDTGIKRLDVDPTNLATLPYLFLASPGNDHHYSNKGFIPQRTLLENMQKGKIEDKYLQGFKFQTFERWKRNFCS